MIDQETSTVDLSGLAVDLDYCSEGSEARRLSMNLKKQLQLLLDHKEMSPTQLAKKSGVSKQVLSLWLSGSSPRKIEQVKKVAEALETSVDHLCFGSGIEKKSEAPNDDWLSGIFEIKVRRISKDKT